MNLNFSLPSLKYGSVKPLESRQRDHTTNPLVVGVVDINPFVTNTYKKTLHSPRIDGFHALFLSLGMRELGLSPSHPFLAIIITVRFKFCLMILKLT